MSCSSNLDDFRDGGKWLYSCCFMECCFLDLFNIARSLLVRFLSTFFSIRLVSVHAVHPYSSKIGTNCVLFYWIGKIVQILLAYGLPKQTVAVITMLYKNTKIKVCLLDGDKDFFDIVAGVLQGDELAPYLFIIYQDYVLQTLIDLMKENDFTL